MKFFLALALGLLSACSLAPGGGQIGAAVDGGLRKAVADIRTFNDGAMQLGLDVMCAPSVGAYFRLPAGNEKTAVRLACDPSAPVVILPESPESTIVMQAPDGMLPGPQPTPLRLLPPQ